MKYFFDVNSERSVSVDLDAIPPNDTYVWLEGQCYLVTGSVIHYENKTIEIQIESAEYFIPKRPKKDRNYYE